MKKFVIAIVLAAMLCSVAFAKVPQVGDRVFIYSGLSSGYKGTITDIENGLICLDTTDGDSKEDGKTDTCIGIGAIQTLSWLD
ncbi:MAG TPA: hypothetical protein PLQ38_04065 [Methanothrix sp.]|nr:hypothetical protein [Methanothrix sp.]